MNKKEIADYYLEVKSIMKVCNKFKIGKLKVKEALNEYNIDTNKKGGRQEYKHKITPISDDKVLVCKLTGEAFDDVNNKSGSITSYIREKYPNDTIPETQYKRKSYEMKHGEKWYIKYFDLKDKEYKDTRKCKECDWETTDVDNKTGCFENHVKDNHGSLEDYLNKHPEDKKYHKKYLKQKELESKGNHVVCKICNEKLQIINNTHLKKHNITLAKYKVKYQHFDTVSINYRNRLSEQLSKMNKKIVNNYISKPHKEISNLLKKYNIKHKNNSKKLLKGIEIDIIIDSLKLGIEFNGLYYHSEKMGKDKNYHINKTKLMNIEGYRLIHIFEDEWNNNKELVVNKILHICGVNNNKIIGARKCEIKEIDTKLKTNFLNNNHIQGSDKSNIYLGAFYGKKLLSVMTLKNNNRVSNNTNEIEISRFTTDINTKVPGIFGKFIKFIKNKYNYNKIYSFGDIRWVDETNNIYNKNGFDLVKVNKPDYSYYNSSENKYKRYHKFNFSKSKIKNKYPKNYNKNKTEKELMQELGFTRIWDCGLFKFELDIKKEG